MALPFGQESIDIGGDVTLTKVSQVPVIFDGGKLAVVVVVWGSRSKRCQLEHTFKYSQTLTFVISSSHIAFGDGLAERENVDVVDVVGAHLALVPGEGDKRAVVVESEMI